MIIIGFGHKKRVGKDQSVQFAMAFARQYYPSLIFGVLSFGDQLKKVAYLMFKWAGLEEAMYYENHPTEIDEILLSCGLTPRQIWDKVGLMGRDIYSKVWVQMAIAEAPEADVLFSKDVRFPTEIELIDEFHGFKYRVDRTAAPGGAVDQALNDYKGWNGIIDNNGSLRQLNTTIKTLVANHLNRLVSPDKVVCPLCYTKNHAVLNATRGELTTMEYTCTACQRGFNA